MAPSRPWLDLHTAPTAEALQNGDGCHRDEVQTLNNYLNNSITIEEAADEITKPILHESKPADETYRLWGLLCDAFVDLEKDDRSKSLDLLFQIQTLPPTPDVNWSELPGFFSMWVTQYGGHWTGGDPPGIRMAIEASDKEALDDFRERSDAIGRVEAEMFLRDFMFCMGERAAYKVLNLVSSDRPGVEVYVGQIFAWLDVAGEKLKEKAMLENGLAEDWARWKEALLKLSQQGSRLSDEARKVAARCHELM